MQFNLFHFEEFTSQQLFVQVLLIILKRLFGIGEYNKNFKNPVLFKAILQVRRHDGSNML